MPWSAVVGAVASGVVGSVMGDSGGSSGGESSAMQAQIGKEQWDRYKTVYAPLEDKYVADAQEYGSPAQFDKVAGEANATNNAQFGKARQRLLRTPGLDPSSAAFATGMVNMDLAQAAAGANSQNAARDRLTDAAWARRTDALSLGKNLPAQASSTLGAAANNNLTQSAYNQQQANSQGRAIGGIVSKGFDAWGKSNNSNTPVDMPEQLGEFEFI